MFPSSIDRRGIILRLSFFPVVLERCCPQYTILWLWTDNFTHTGVTNWMEKRLWLCLNRYMLDNSRSVRTLEGVVYSVILFLYIILFVLNFSIIKNFWSKSRPIGHGKQCSQFWSEAISIHPGIFIPGISFFQSRHKQKRKHVTKK